ncbi:MAG: hypothetical protein N2C14_15665 [Planctomycetales bacterium]
MVDRPCRKAAKIERLGIGVVFDDSDEALIQVPEGVAVFKPRSVLNYDFALRKWLLDSAGGAAWL